MSKLVFDRGNFTDFTSVSNVFIDKYMPKASGEFTKIYLYLLRLVNTDCEDLSISKIADCFNMLENDVVRALNYWSSQGLLSLSVDQKGYITCVKLESLIKSRYIVRNLDKDVNTSSDVSGFSVTEDSYVEDAGAEMLSSASGESVPAAIPSASGIIVPSKKKYSPAEISSFSDNESFNQLTFLAQTYLGKTLNSSDINSILYMLDRLKLDASFIEYIMETCISSGHKSLSYIEKTAVRYFERYIRTVTDAKNDGKLRKDICDSIYKIFGLTSKAPIKKEISYINKWTEDFGFSDDIILEACNRTMEHTHSASFQYADKILFSWAGENVKSLSDIEKLDKQHTENNAKLYASQVSKPARKRKSKTFEQRTYDYNQLEKQIIKVQEKR
jgi:DnaD/phage-associated family protein